MFFLLVMCNYANVLALRVWDYIKPILRIHHPPDNEQTKQIISNTKPSFLPILRESLLPKSVVVAAIHSAF